ncbi:MAG: hypothetical protein FWH26_02990 [Oscillospiraceae bacterium]|nr:hypothetical protein [Oscillospiraceae bacterium]
MSDFGLRIGIEGERGFLIMLSLFSRRGKAPFCNKQNRPCRGICHSKGDFQFLPKYKPLP